ncbi:hypothetical protein BDY21DRAFT_28022 [Lineolata rhizophorae]|uniref:Uncharacterized protein n=1 Tax=Lineolata rhizophorae TaxID=578093 RepID=A0A6A6P260_9PEZI|nr:hypothetical protein BDY21DRAFT_28022 [Lineolata rhizophorae]
MNRSFAPSSLRSPFALCSNRAPLPPPDLIISAHGHSRNPQSRVRDVHGRQHCPCYIPRYVSHRHTGRGARTRTRTWKRTRLVHVDDANPDDNNSSCSTSARTVTNTPCRIPHSALGTYGHTSNQSLPVRITPDDPALPESTSHFLPTPTPSSPVTHFNRTFGFPSVSRQPNQNTSRTPVAVLIREPSVLWAPLPP